MTYDTIRDALPITGKKIADVTCTDWDEVCEKYPDPEERVTVVYIHFDDGTTMAFFCTPDQGFWYDGYGDEETE